jgi:hypothetical protein
MYKIISTACAALMAVSVPFAAPAVAMPLAAPAWHQSQDATQIQYRDRENWRRGGYERRGRDTYYRGHRGYRDYRPGYRRHGDFWFPAAALIAGAIISGAIANQPRYNAPPARYGRGDPHLEWCYARYRSYRSSDNTFQPYNGPRRQCTSPYG